MSELSLTGCTASVNLGTNIRFVARSGAPLRAFERSAHVGAFIMLGTLLGLIALVFGLVLHFDPEACRTPSEDRDQ